VSGKKITVPSRHHTREISNLIEYDKNFVHLIPNKLAKSSPNVVEKYYFIAQLLIVEYQHCSDLTFLLYDV